MNDNEENHLIAERRAKLAKLRERGNAFPNDFRRDALAADILTAYGAKSAEVLDEAAIRVRVAGRMRAKRVMGKASFAKLEDSSGAIQVFLQQQTLGEIYDEFKGWDVGDVIGAEGTLFRTKTGELSVRAQHLKLLTKSLRPLPDKGHGIADTELRYRRRYVDLIMNQESRRVFETRSRIVRYLRAFLDARGFLEVETPMLHPIPGGAAARPFKTHHNALDVDMYLRIAPELYLKRLTVGGFDRVYEINRNFRNEGISTQHNPEFTMLEFYEAYSNYRDLMDMNERLFADLAKAITGSTAVRYGEVDLDFGKFQRLTMREAIVKYWPDAAGAAPRMAELAAPGGPRAIAERYNVWAKNTGAPYAASKGSSSDGEWTGLLFESMAEDKLVQPTILYEFPTDISPLSKQKPDDPSVTERFEIFVAGMEIANGFSELNDPIEQERRFRAQIAQGGDEVPKQVDWDYIRALCHGMPPTAGEGIGIDRLTMLFTGSPSIRDVILFPQLRPEAPASPEQGTEP